MKKLIFLFGILVVFIFVGVVFAQDSYSNALNKAKEVRNQVEEKVQEETKSITTPTTTNLTIPTVTATNEVTPTIKNKISDEHRSKIAIFVQELLKSADRFQQENPGIGEKVRAIAKEQNESAERISSSLDKIQKRNSVIKFLIGPNYNEIKKTKQELEQNRLRIQNLNQIMNQLQNQGDKTLLQEQVQNLEQENTELQNFISQEERTFSLFGWLIKLFQ
jgi:uncharacterized protein YpmB